VAIRHGRHARRPCYVRLTNLRLCTVEHFVFRADVATEVPPEAVRSVALDGPAVMVCWERENGSERIAAFVERSGAARSGPALGGRLPDSPSEFAERLTRWSRGGSS